LKISKDVPEWDGFTRKPSQFYKVNSTFLSIFTSPVSLFIIHECTINTINKI